MAGMSPLLGLGLATSGVAQGLAQGKQAGTQQYRSEVEFNENREAALRRKKQGDLLLQQMEFQNQRMMDPNRIQQQDDILRMQLEQMQMQTQQMGAQMFQQSTYRALDDYLEDYNPKHLDVWIQEARKNPQAPENLKNTLKVERLNPNAIAEHKQLLARAGIREEELDALDGQQDGKIDWDLVSKRYVKVLEQNPETGEVEESIRDIYTLGAATGYHKYARDSRLEALKAMAVVQGKGGSTPTSLREAQALAEARERIEAGNGTPQDYATVETLEAKRGGVKSVQQRSSEAAIDEFYAKGFDKLPVDVLRDETKPEGREAMRLVREIEQSYGLTEADRKEIRTAQRNISSLSRAINLDPETRGFIDAPFAQLGKYFTEQGSKGRQAAAAYNSFINQIRNDLFGSALTEKEIEMFDKAYGTDKQAMTVTLSGLYELADSLDQSLEAISLLNDPIVVKARTGRNREEVAAAKENILNRITFFETYAAELAAGKSKRQAEIIARQKAGVGEQTYDESPIGRRLNQTSATANQRPAVAEPKPPLSDDDIAKALGF